MRIRHLQDAAEFERQKRAKAEQAARDRLTGALTPERLEEVGEAAIREHAGYANAYPYVPGIGTKASTAAVEWIRRRVKPFLLPRDDFRAALAADQGTRSARHLQRHEKNLKRAIVDWRGWWRRQAAKLLPEVTAYVAPTHEAESKALAEASRQEAEQRRAAERTRHREAGRPRVSSVTSAPATNRPVQPDSGRGPWD